MRCRAILTAICVGLLASACASGANPSETSATRPPQPAGKDPSAISLMVCAKEAQSELTLALGVRAVVQDRSWIAHKYSCTYVYSNGSIALSVQELSSWNQTFSYYHGLGQQLGDTEPVSNLGQGAFRTTNGDIVVRKDWKVLLVNIAGLPGVFGKPPTQAFDVAYTVADVILACWEGD